MTVRVEPILRQSEPVAADSVSATLPDAQLDGATGIVGGADPPSETVRLTGALVGTDTPADGLEPVTVPAGNRELGIPPIAWGERPASRRRLAAASWLMPMMFGTTTECPGAAEVVQAETVRPMQSRITAPSRPFNPGSYRRNPP